jgi:hypothetical protein
LLVYIAVCLNWRIIFKYCKNMFTWVFH